MKRLPTYSDYLEGIKRIASKISKNIKIMTFCGTHEHTVHASGIRSILPENVEIVAGPGCPVCVTPAYVVDNAIRLSMEGITVYTFGDAYRLPGIRWVHDKSFPRNLEASKQQGGSVKVIYSPLDIAKEKPGRESVFLAIGFETTVLSTVSIIERFSPIGTFSVLMAHKLTPPVMDFALKAYGKGELGGIIAPGHVSAVIGAEAWRFLPEKYGIPTVVSGFDPQDVVESIYYILAMIYLSRPQLLNQYARAVKRTGLNGYRAALNKWFKIESSLWRGLGWIPESGLSIKEEHKEIDAESRYSLLRPKEGESVRELPPGCKCGEVTLGIKKPTECPLFLKACYPEKPYGPCMVSSEGTCYIWAKYGGRSHAKGL